MKASLSTSILCAVMAVAALTAISSRAVAMPAQVLIIRHGEKPDSGDHLNAQGQARAQALVHFFETDPAATAFGKIAGVYAVSPHDEDGSTRAIETVSATAAALGVDLNSDFTKKKVDQIFADVANNPAFDGKTVVICWERKLIPDLAAAFGLQNGPEKWDGKDVFDRMWILRYSASGQVSFQDVGQHLLPGDSL